MTFFLLDGSRVQVLADQQEKTTYPHFRSIAKEDFSQIFIIVQATFFPVV